jgi:hypothetical protein
MSEISAIGEQPVDLQELIRRFNPNLPAGTNDFTIPRTPRESSAIRQIAVQIGADPRAKVLLTGHIGVGKSTEILNLGRQMESERFVVSCSTASTLGAHNVNAFSLLVVILEATVRNWTSRIGDLPPGLVESIKNRLKGLDKKVKLPPPFREFLAASQSLFSEVGPRGGELAALLSNSLGNLAFRSETPHLVSSSDLQDLQTCCEEALKELENQTGKPVLLLIDDLDKVRNEDSQREVFVDRAMAWIRLPCGLLSTLPLDVLFGPLGSDLDQLWGDVQVLEPLPVPDRSEKGVGDPSKVKDPLLQIYLAILESVGADDAISALQCRRLAFLASGLLRQFVQYCGSAIRYASSVGLKHVRDTQIDLVEQDMAAKWSGRLNDSDYQSLIEVLDSHGRNLPKALPLLRDGLLIRERGNDSLVRFRVPAWVMPFVDQYRKRDQARKKA